MNFSKNFHRRFDAILLVGLATLAHGSVSDADLQKQYGGEVLTLRRFYPGKRLHFNSTGALVSFDLSSSGIPGAWTADGQVRVQTISLKDGVVHILGQRLFFFFDPESKQLRDVGSLTKNDKARKLFHGNVVDWAAKEGKTEIEVECSMSRPEVVDLTKAMNAVFLASGESLVEVAPDFWKSYLSEPTLEPKERIEKLRSAQESVFLIKDGVSPPRVISEPEPSYSEPARRAKYQATTTLALIVDEDGLPQHIQVLVPAGMGMDEAAVDAVRNWRFSPARKDGKEVKVCINVEAKFHL